MKAYLFTLLFFLLCGALPGQNALRDAEELTRQHAYEASSARLLAFIEEHPERKYDLGRAWALHSYNLLQQGKPEMARTANEKSFQLRRQLRSPEISENYLRIAQIDLAAKNFSNALVAAEQGMQMLIENPRIYADLNLYAAKALHKLGREEESNQYFSTARDVVLIEVGNRDRAYAELLYAGGVMAQERHAHEEAFTMLATAFYAATEPVLRSKALIKAWQAYCFSRKG